MATTGYILSLPGADAASFQTFIARNINLLATGQTLVAAAQTGKKLVPVCAYLRVVSLTGVVAVAPIVRLGNNGSFNNVAALFTMVAAAVDAVDSVPLVTSLTAVDVGSAGVSADVQTAVTGPSVLTADVIVQALLL